MNGWLLDTNVVSELRRPKPNPGVAAFVASVPLDDLFLSVVNLAEIRFGIFIADVSRQPELEHWLEQVIRPMYAGRILPISEEVLLRWRILLEQGRKAGRTFSQPDLIFASIASEHDLTLVTRNVRDFPGTGVRLHNPWQ